MSPVSQSGVILESPASHDSCTRTLSPPPTGLVRTAPPRRRAAAHGRLERRSPITPHRTSSGPLPDTTVSTE